MARFIRRTENPCTVYKLQHSVEFNGRLTLGYITYVHPIRLRGTAAKRRFASFIRAHKHRSHSHGGYNGVYTHINSHGQVAHSETRPRLTKWRETPLLLGWDHILAFFNFLHWAEEGSTRVPGQYEYPQGMESTNVERDNAERVHLSTANRSSSLFLCTKRNVIHFTICLYGGNWLRFPI
jgi:hypothetical protein